MNNEQNSTARTHEAVEPASISDRIEMMLTAHYAARSSETRGLCKENCTALRNAATLGYILACNEFTALLAKKEPCH